METNENNSNSIDNPGSSNNSSPIVQETSESILEKAERAAKQMEERIKEFEKLQAKQEEIMARQVLKGRSEAGIAPPAPKPREEIIKEELNKMFKQLSPYYKH